MAVIGEDRLDRVLDRLLLGQIARICECGAALGANLRRDLGEFVGAPGDQDDPRTRSAIANAAARPIPDDAPVITT